MKLKYIYIAIVCTLLLSVALILSNIFSNAVFLSKTSNTYFIYSFLIKIVFLIATISYIKKHNLKLSVANDKYHLFLIFIVCYTIYSIFNILGKSNLYNFEIDIERLFYYTIYVFSTGIFEEVFFRLLIFAFIYKALVNSNLFIISIVSSLIFSLFHLYNLVFGSTDIANSLFQIVFAFGVGLFFQTLLIKTRRLYHLIIFHALINFNGGLNNFFEIASTKTEISKSGFDYFSFIVLLIYTTIIVIVSYFLLRNHKRNIFHSSKEIKIEKLGILKN